MGPHHAYRPDIDGLRAVAVLAVLAFHAFPRAVPGGFAGVDVFFVISGFLISGIIFDGLRAGNFSFADFYWRRVRRIFPALILVLAACLGFGWLALLPDEYTELGRHVAAGAAFLSNFALWQEAGYFDTAAERKPLLHLWSLGVEEQYYILWPLLLFLFRRNPARMLWLVLALVGLSFAANLWLVGRSPSAAFYLPFSRFWELLAGSVLAYFLHYRSLSERFCEAKAYAGLGLIVASFLLLHGQNSFPGWWALAPIAGTVLLIWAGPAAAVNRHVLSHPAMVFVGLISYPLYLWHWPLLSYARIVEGGEPATPVRIALCAVSVLLAWLTYEHVEKKVRFAKLPSVRRIAAPALAASMAVVGAAGVLALQTRLQPHSASLPEVLEISRAHTDWGYDGDRVIVGDTGRAVLFIGDSHMRHYWPRLEKLATERTGPMHTIIFKTTGGCAPLPGIERKNRRCSAFVEEALALARDPTIDTVVLAASWVGFVNRGDYYKVGDPARKPLKLLATESEWVFERFQATLAELGATGKRVVIVLSSPRGSAFHPKSVIDRDLTVRVRGAFAPVPRTEIAALVAPIDERLKRIAAAVGAAVIDPADYLCTASHCPSADDRGRPLYMDASHLRASVARERFRAVDRYVYANRIGL